MKTGGWKFVFALALRFGLFGAVGFLQWWLFTSLKGAGNFIQLGSLLVPLGLDAVLLVSTDILFSPARLGFTKNCHREMYRDDGFFKTEIVVAKDTFLTCLYVAYVALGVIGLIVSSVAATGLIIFSSWLKSRKDPTALLGCSFVFGVLILVFTGAKPNEPGLIGAAVAGAVAYFVLPFVLQKLDGKIDWRVAYFWVDDFVLQNPVI